MNTNIINAKNTMSNTSLVTLGTTPALGSLDAYIKWAKSLPILSVPEEKELTQQLHSKNDLNAARQLVLAHLRFVVHIAQGYHGYGLPLEDLIQVGNIGLMKAVKKFNPMVGVRLITFAVHWIKSEIHEFVLRNWRIVKVATTKAQRKLFFNLRKLTSASRWLNAKEIESIAKELRVNPREVQTMESRLLNHDVAFSVREDDDGGNGGGNTSGNDRGVSGAESYLTDDSNNPYLALAESDWSQNRTERLEMALTSLDERSRDIVEQRWLQESKATLHDLSLKYHVSMERIRQIEEQALKKIRGYFETTAGC